MTDDRPRALEPDAAGDLPLAELIKTAADAVEVGTPDDYNPTEGRVLDDAQTEQVWLGDGTDWNDIDHTVGIDLAGLPGVQVVRSADDLPDASGGVRQLEAGTTYLFADFVSDPATLELGSGMGSPLIGWHGGQSGYIHTGGTTVIQGTDAPVFVRNATFTGPGATMFDLTADAEGEILAESCNFGDPGGFGNFASLGTIDGYRVPSFKGCNFEDFDAGLTFTGNSDKLFFSECPFRSVDAAGVQCLTLDSGLDVDIIDIADCYVKGVQSDTEVVTVEAGADPNEIFQYRGVTHDPTVTPDNILNGTASQDSVGYRIRDSYPLPDSETTGELDLTAATEVTGSGAAPTEVDGSFTLVNDERVSQVNGNRIQYDGKKDVKVVVHAVASISGANTDFAMFIGKNGSELPRTESKSFNPNANTPAGVTAVSTLTLTTGDTVSAFLENTGGSGDLTAEALAITV